MYHTVPEGKQNHLTRNQDTKQARHISRMNNRMPKIILNYKSNGRRQFERPLKVALGEAATGLSRPTVDR
jgi:predicted amidophosphoribosyltransferase